MDGWLAVGCKVKWFLCVFCGITMGMQSTLSQVVEHNSSFLCGI